MCDEIDGLEIIRPDRKCPDSMHDFVPIIEGTRVVGLICQLCGHRVREELGSCSITSSGKIILQNAKPRRDL